jgi:hypothetical protein
VTDIESPEDDPGIAEAATEIHIATRAALGGADFLVDPADVSAVAIAVLRATARQFAEPIAAELRALADHLDAVDIEHFPNTPQVVAICGSTRFRSEMAAANRELTLAGYIVVAPGVFTHDGDQMTDRQKLALADLDLRKIDLADLVYVVNPGGYIGDSTRREIAYARSAGKRVRFLVEDGGELT